MRFALVMLALVAACSDSGGPSKTAPSAPVRELSSAGNLTCAVTADSTAWCWGHGFGPRPVPWASNYKFRYVSVAATPSGNYLCGVTGGREVVCQGTVVVDSSGAWDLGSTPTVLTADTAVDTISTGASHLCGVNSGHHAWCWGEYAAGDRGDSIIPAGRDSFATPSLVAGGHLWSGVAAGASHSCGMATDRTVFCWGAGVEVGVPDSASYDTSAAHCGTSLHGGAPCTYVPLQLTTVPAASGVVSAASTTCALTTVNTVWCWGYVGPTAGKVSQVPVAMPLSTNAIAVALGSAGGYCIVSPAHDAYCGILGSAPTIVPGGLGFVNVSTGADHACGIGVTNLLFCWGSNGEGQLGVGDSTARSVPVQVVIPDSTS